MREYQAVVRVRHDGTNLSKAGDQLDTVTGKLVEYGTTGAFWDDVSEFTMTVRVPSLWDVAAFAGRTVRDAFGQTGLDPKVIRVDAWNVAEWDREHGVDDDGDE
ncbi:hypothetical protein [Streptomyces sp. NBC_01751]|uniref:hypothetical protein n=1 Tax=Streptomyces sp. NBC_01751 TaxID=2975929 RepID=UPI002DDB1B99|nr:hypothetical protein [Streptomyces sp. NBC_01751]WSD23371.1 hypothetical protein OHA26_07705 [Streptomyces sp. NBC_01751]